MPTAEEEKYCRKGIEKTEHVHVKSRQVRRKTPNCRLFSMMLDALVAYSIPLPPTPMHLSSFAVPLSGHASGP